MEEYTVDSAMVRAAFAAVGAVPGDTVVFHGSLKSMGWVEGGVAAVIDGALLAAAPGGTVAVPTLWYDGTPARRAEDFDIANSPAYNGALAEGMRRDPRSIRSNHYSHSVNAIGPRAVELTSGHGGGARALSPWPDAFNEISPWSRFYEWNALYCFIGTGMRPCTMKHWVESRYLSRLLERLPSGGPREAAQAEISPGPARIWPYADMSVIQPLLSERGLLRKAMLGRAEVIGIRTRPLVDALMEFFLTSPEKCFRPNFLDWLTRHGLR